MRDRDGMRARETGRETVVGARRRALQHATFTKRQTSMLFSMQGRTTERASPTFSRPELRSLSSPRLQIKTIHVVYRSEIRPHVLANFATFSTVFRVYDLAEMDVTNVISPVIRARYTRACVCIYIYIYMHELSVANGRC